MVDIFIRSTADVAMEGHDRARLSGRNGCTSLPHCSRWERLVAALAWPSSLSSGPWASGFESDGAADFFVLKCPLSYEGLRLFGIQAIKDASSDAWMPMY